MTLTTTQRALDRNQSHEIPNHWPVGFAPPGGELLLGRLTRVVLAEAGRAAVEAGGLGIRPPPSPRLLHRAGPGGHGAIPPSEHAGARSHFADGKIEALRALPLA